ncbi:GIY-YIG nuclease family protein [Dechloromonas sp. ZY10]|uniref:GIY-YIG nuclease family protein n=1 Tax=Dechloromonas aquae TaxID=2664436 RepID=UPI003526EE0F
MSDKPWFLYLIECRDGSIYTGITVDVAARYAAHCAGKGARYTRSHPPQQLLAWAVHGDRAAAAREEFRVKQLSPGEKRRYAAVLGLPTMPPGPVAGSD